MTNVRVFSYILVIVLLFQVNIGKPVFYLDAWCDLICDRNSTNPDDNDEFCDCAPRRPREQQYTIFPSTYATNITVSKKNGVCQINMVAWSMTTTPTTPVVLPNVG